jgi:hypothetical protein
VSAPNGYLSEPVTVEVVDGVLLIGAVPSCPWCLDPSPCEQQHHIADEVLQMSPVSRRQRQIWWVTG